MIAPGSRSYALAALAARRASRAPRWSSALLAPRADAGRRGAVRGEARREPARDRDASRAARPGARRARHQPGGRGCADRPSELHAGQYWLSPALSPSEIIDTLASGRVATWEVVIPEGLTAAEIGAAVRRARDRRRARVHRRGRATPRSRAELGIPARSLEGYLFPETYRLPRGADRARGGARARRAVPRGVAPGRGARGRARALDAPGGDARLDRREGDGRLERAPDDRRRCSRTGCAWACASSRIPP